MNDVIVKVDDEDVQGQPLSTLRCVPKRNWASILTDSHLTIHAAQESYSWEARYLRGSGVPSHDGKLLIIKFGILEV